MLPSAPVRKFGARRSSRIRISTPGKGGPMPVPPGSAGLARTQPGARDEAEFGGAVVLEDGGVRCPAAGRLQRPRVELGAGADDAADAGGVDPAGEAALAEQPEHGGDQDQPGDAVVADGGVRVADVELLRGCGIPSRRTGIRRGRRGSGWPRAGRAPGSCRPRSGRRTRWTRRRTAARTAAMRVNALGTDVVPEVRPIRNGDSGGPSASSLPELRRRAARPPRPGRRPAGTVPRSVR